jgi:2-oxoisovalerate dehydrogenase E1 component beta subunit
MRLCGPDVPAMPISPPLEKQFMLNKEKVKEAMRQLAIF